MAIRRFEAVEVLSKEGLLEALDGRFILLEDMLEMIRGFKKELEGNIDHPTEGHAAIGAAAAMETLLDELEGKRGGSYGKNGDRKTSN